MLSFLTANSLTMTKKISILQDQKGRYNHITINYMKVRKHLHQKENLPPFTALYKERTNCISPLINIAKNVEENHHHILHDKYSH